jgi:CRISPR system Cascade subunit CasD
MATLLLQLVGPLQSWGTQSHYTHRDTGLEPSKSGVIGLLCAALGRGRSEPLADLAALRMGVRVDREGVVLRDYHTAQNVMKAEHGPFRNLKKTELSDRFYLADAAFLVGLEGSDLALLSHLQHRLQHPVWPLYLGRKAYVPGTPVRLKDGLRPAESLEFSLRSYQRIAEARPLSYSAAEVESLARVVVEDPVRGSIERNDQPLSFALGARQFNTRLVYIDFYVPSQRSVEAA